MNTLWARLYEQLSAIETLGVCRQGPGLNARGERVLRYIEQRMRRSIMKAEKV